MRLCRALRLPSIRRIAQVTNAIVKLCCVVSMNTYSNMQSPSPALLLNFMAEPCACDCTCHECVMCGQQSPAPAISFYSSRAGCNWMVEASCGDQHRDGLGEQQRAGLQTGLAWTAGASDFPRKAGHRLPS